MKYLFLILFAFFLRIVVFSQVSENIGEKYTIKAIKRGSELEIRLLSGPTPINATDINGKKYCSTNFVINANSIIFNEKDTLLLENIKEISARFELTEAMKSTAMVFMASVPIIFYVIFIKTYVNPNRTFGRIGPLLLAGIVPAGFFISFAFGKKATITPAQWKIEFVKIKYAND